MRIIVLKLIFIFASLHLSAQANQDSISYFNKLFSYQLMAVNKQKNTTLPVTDKPLLLFIFLSPECPLCQNYTQKINELKNIFNQQLTVYGIVPGKAYSVKEVEIFADTYHINFDIFIDEQQKFTHYLQATVTPQAILLDDKMKLIYTGAIDDWIQAQGKKKLHISRKFLRIAIEQSLQSEEVLIKKTKVFGCKINDY